VKLRILAILAVALFALPAFTHAAPALTPTLVGEGQAGGTACTSGCTGMSLSWTEPPLPTGVVACSSTVTTNCWKGYQATITPPSGSGGAVTTINDSTLTNALTTYTWRPGGALYYGTWTVSLVATGVGSVSNSLPATATVVYNAPPATLASPTNVTATPVQ